MQGITIRPATAEDVGDIARIHVESWQSNYAGILPGEFLLGLDSAQHDARWWRRFPGRFRCNHFVYVVEERDQGTFGLASAEPSRNRMLPFGGEVYTTHVRDAYHGNGVGRLFFANAVAGVQEARGPSVIVWCLSENSSRFFYERMGGALVVRRPGKAGNAVVEEIGCGWEDASKLVVWGSA